MRETASLIEPCVTPDIFIEGIGAIEQVGPCARFVLYCTQSGERVVVAKVVIPIASLPDAILQATAFLAEQVAQPIINLTKVLTARHH